MQNQRAFQNCGNLDRSALKKTHPLFEIPTEGTLQRWLECRPRNKWIGNENIYVTVVEQRRSGDKPPSYTPLCSFIVIWLDYCLMSCSMTSCSKHIFQRCVKWKFAFCRCCHHRKKIPTHDWKPIVTAYKIRRLWALGITWYAEPTVPGIVDGQVTGLLIGWVMTGQPYSKNSPPPIACASFAMRM